MNINYIEEYIYQSTEPPRKQICKNNQIICNNIVSYEA